MIGTSLKSPMSGTRISLVLIMNLLRRRGLGASRPDPSQDQAANVLKHGAEVTGEAGRERAVDHPVIVGQRDRLHQAGPELGSVPHRRHLRAHDAEDRSRGGVEDWRESRPADAAKARDREARALHVGYAELAVARLLRDLAHFLADLVDALA